MSFDEAVVVLHDIARLVEKQVGTGQLSQDIRSCADRLNTLVKPVTSEENAYDTVI